MGGALSILLAAALGQAAMPFPSRGGSSGALDVPDAEALPLSAARLGFELRMDRPVGSPPSLGPSPVALGIGLGAGFELGASLREGGRPGDPRPSPVLFGAELKWRAVGFGQDGPGMAIAATADRVNWELLPGARLVASTGALGPLRASAFGGVDVPLSGAARELRAGASAALRLGPVELVGEGLWGPEGVWGGGALRFSLGDRLGVGLAASYFPWDGRLLLSLALGFTVPVRRPAPPAPIAAPPPIAAEPAPAAAPPPARVQSGVPRFRLRIGTGETQFRIPRPRRSIDAAAPAPSPIGGAVTPAAGGAVAAPPVPPAAAPQLGADDGLQKALAAAGEDVQRCAPGGKPPAGSITIHIERRGRVALLKSGPGVKGTALEKCMAKAAWKWRFPARGAPYSAELKAGGAP